MYSPVLDILWGFGGDCGRGLGGDGLRGLGGRCGDGLRRRKGDTSQLLIEDDRRRKYTGDGRRMIEGEVRRIRNGDGLRTLLGLRRWTRDGLRMRADRSLDGVRVRRPTGDGDTLRRREPEPWLSLKGETRRTRIGDACVLGVFTLTKRGLGLRFTYGYATIGGDGSDVRARPLRIRIS